MEIIAKNHQVSEIGYHFVWCTKFRKPILTDEVEIAVRNSIGKIALDYQWKIHSLEIMPDHVHVFLQSLPSDSPATIVAALKSVTAIQVFSQVKNLKKKSFWGTGLWSRGYYVGTCGNMSKKVIEQYIKNQKKK